MKNRAGAQSEQQPLASALVKQIIDPLHNHQQQLLLTTTPISYFSQLLNF